MRQTITYSNGFQVTLIPGETVQQRDPGDLPRLPKGRKFGVLKHDFFPSVYGVSRPTKNGSANHVLGLPETIKVLQPVFMPMTEEWQWFAADLLALARYKALYKDLNMTQQYNIRVAFKSTYVGFRAFTNRHGWSDGYRDYVNNVNPGQKPMEQETINTGGNVVELLSDKLKISGQEVYKVRQLDAGTKSNPKHPPDPKQVNSILTPWFTVRATNSQRIKIMNGEKWTGRWIEDVVEAFPQNDGYDVPVAFMGMGPFNYIDARRVIVLPDNAEIPSPYHKHGEPYYDKY